MHQISLIETFKDRRKDIGITQEVLSELSGVSLRTLKQFESGKGNPTVQTVDKLANVLGLELCFQIKVKHEKRESIFQG